MDPHHRQNILCGFLLLLISLPSLRFPDLDFLISSLGTGNSVQPFQQTSTGSPESTPNPISAPTSDFQKVYLPLISAWAPLTPHNTDQNTLVGAGDISYCGYTGDDQTAELIKNIPGVVMTMGDNSQQSGTVAQYEDCYSLSWGQFKSRIRPAPGNHDYGTAGAAGYYNYFSAAAGEPGKGYYSYDLGQWHIVVLNSNCSAVGGCTKDSPQGKWLEQDLSSHPTQCSLAYFHHPRWSSGQHGNNSQMDSFWQLFYQYHLDVVLNGHDHGYERFAPMDPEGNYDPQSGIREFVVGTGGMTLRSFGAVQPNSQVRDASSWGVLKLSLQLDRYEWEFLPVEGASFQDSGSDVCR